MKFDKDFFENILVCDRSDQRIVKVLGMSEEVAVTDGENFTTVIQRVTLDVLLGSSRRSKITFIVKKIPDSAEMRNFHEKYGYFNAEIYAFKHVLSKMSRLMAELRDFRETLWCDVKTITESAFIFEDLCAKGYTKISRSEFFNEEYSMAVLRSLARFHAMGLALIKRNLVNAGELGNYIIYRNGCTDEFIKPAITTLKKAIEESWGPEWNDVLHPMSRIIDRYDEIIEETKVVTNKSLMTTIHGDCWSGNIMFKKDLDGRILSIKILDYQVLSYSSFAFDLCVALHCAVDDKLRREKYDELLSVYHKNLLLNMDFFKLDISAAPSLSEVHHILENLRVLTFILKCLYFPFLHSTEIVDFSTNNEKPIFTSGMFKTEKAKKVLGGKLRELVENDLI